MCLLYINILLLMLWISILIKTGSQDKVNVHFVWEPTPTGIGSETHSFNMSSSRLTSSTVLLPNGIPSIRSLNEPRGIEALLCIHFSKQYNDWCTFLSRMEFCQKRFLNKPRQLEVLLCLHLNIRLGS